MENLKPHHQSCRECGYRNDILKSNKAFTEHHLCLPAECTAHHLYRFRGRDKQSR